MHRHNHVFVYKLIYPIFEIKSLVNWSRDNGVKLTRASEHICLHNSKDRGENSVANKIQQRQHKGGNLESDVHFCVPYFAKLDHVILESFLVD